MRQTTEKEGEKRERERKDTRCLRMLCCTTSSRLRSLPLFLSYLFSSLAPSLALSLHLLLHLLPCLPSSDFPLFVKIHLLPLYFHLLVSLLSQLLFLPAQSPSPRYSLLSQLLLHHLIITNLSHYRLLHNPTRHSPLRALPYQHTASPSANNPAPLEPAALVIVIAVP